MKRLFLLAAMFALVAQCQQLRLDWGELKAWTGPQYRIRIVTRQNVELEARIQTVHEDRLVVAVMKSSDKKRYAMGEAVVERAEIREIALRRDSTRARRRGAAVGAIVMGSLGALMGPMADGNAPGAVKALAAGTFQAAVWGTVGYLWGRSIDNAWEKVTLQPPSPPAAGPRAPE
jgi:hypothetical protein